MHAVQALHDGLLQLVDDFGALAGLGVDLVDPLVVDLNLQVLRPAAVAAQPAARVGLLHLGRIVGGAGCGCGLAASSTI